MQSPVNSTAGPSNPHQASEPGDEDTEWEYEYDAEETEDFYVTLDLTTFVAPAKPKRKARASKGSGATRNQERQDDEQNDAGEDADADEDEDDAEDDDVDPAEQPTEPPTPAAPDDEPGPSTRKQGDSTAASAAEAITSPIPNRIQILELHSKHPVISYGGRFYRCSWAEALGTDLIFEVKPEPTSSLASEPVAVDSTRPEEIADDSISAPTQPLETFPSLQPLASHRGFDTIAASKMRLIARPVKLTPRVPPTVLTPKGDTAPGTPTTSGGTTPGTYVARSRQAQADFLTRFAAIKAARGETDEVPFVSRKGRGPRRGQGRGRGQGRNGGQLMTFEDIGTRADNGRMEGVVMASPNDGMNVDTQIDQDVEMGDDEVD